MYECQFEQTGFLGLVYFNMTACNGYEFQSTLIAMEAFVGDTTLHYTALREEAYYS